MKNICSESPEAKLKSVFVWVLLTAIVFLTLMTTVASAQPSDEPTKLEKSVCMAFGFEHKIFSKWKAISDKGAAPRRSPSLSYTSLAHTLSDGRKLSGTRIRATRRKRRPTAALLVLQGNAYRSDYVVPHLTALVTKTVDVFNFDYRGYGKSTGISLLNPIVNDQVSILNRLKTMGYRKIYLYGMSFGGILALMPQVQAKGIAATVIDSTPARLPFFAFCPDRFDPLQNLPPETKSFMVVLGGKDKIVKPSDVQPLGQAVAKHGGRFLLLPHEGHPKLVHGKALEDRLRAAREFFLQH